MTDEQFNAMFRTVADHLESLAISIQNVEDLQEQDRLRQEQDRLRLEQDRTRQEQESRRLDRLERLFKLMLRIGDRERKDLRFRLNALIDAHIRSEDKIERLSAKMEELSATQIESAKALTDFQKKSDERMTRMEESNALFQTQIAEVLTKLAEATAQAHRRLDALESNGTN
jgi:hypothetical protein